jgi:hypothetical protein
MEPGLRTEGPTLGQSLVAAVTNLTTEEVADRFRTSPETVRYWRHTRKGPLSFKVGKRVLYALEDVEAWEREAREGASVA